MPSTSTVISSQGSSVTFGGTSLGKVVSVSGDFSSATKEIRPLSPNLDDATGQYLSIFESTVCDQTVKVESIGASGAATSSIVGSKQSLIVAGDGWYITFPSAICEKFEITAKVGDVVRFSCAFKRTYS